MPLPRSLVHQKPLTAHWPFVAGEIAIVAALTAPVSSVVPRAATHFPTASADAFAAVVVVYVVEPVSVTVTERVVALGVDVGVDVGVEPVALPEPRLGRRM